MKVFITGATGYIGGSVAEALVTRGFEVSGLARGKEKANYLASRKIRPILGQISDTEILAEAAIDADLIINAANSDHRGAVEAILKAIRGLNKTFIHTSGSSIVADAANGEPSDEIYDDDETVIQPHEEKAARVAIDNLVKASATEGVRSIVICPTMIYGRGRGFNKHSVQVPMLISQAKKDGAARYLGRGLNIWSNVHIDDLVDLYLLALEKADAGSFFFAENGEAQLKAIVEEIGRQLRFTATSWTESEAISAFGREAAVFALGSNSRVSARNARELLGWRPRTDDILGSIIEEIVPT
jgi:nucleoside-diphosphate-sugar epimerase